MIEALETIGRALEEVGEAVKNLELSPQLADYLAELDVTAPEWEAMSNAERDTLADTLYDRVQELGLDDRSLANDWIAENCDPSLAERYLERVELDASLESSLGTTGKDFWNDLHMERSDSRTLVSDIAENPQLGERLRENPELLKIYAHNIESHYRTDLTVLRYGHYEADHFRSIYFRQPENRDWIKGEDLRLVDVGSKTEIRHGGNGSVLGYLSGDRRSGYTVEVTGGDALANLYPLRNAEYHVGNSVFRTDDLGRPSRVTTVIEGPVEPAGRDTDHIRRVRNHKSDFDLETGTLRPEAKLEDDGGHLVADSLGGRSTALNIVPQNTTINKGGTWRASEDAALKAANAGSTVERTIDIAYSDRRSLRPSQFTITQKIDGQVTIDNVTIENTPVKRG